MAGREGGWVGGMGGWEEGRVGGRDCTAPRSIDAQFTVGYPACLPFCCFLVHLVVVSAPACSPVDCIHSLVQHGL